MHDQRSGAEMREWERSVRIERKGTRLDVRIGEAFTMCSVADSEGPTACRIHPALTRLPGGRLILAANVDGDIEGAEQVAYASDDDGTHWPWTYRFMEDNKPEEQGSYNNAMIRVTPNRLLLAYDHGGNSGKIPEYSGPKRIVGHFIEISGSVA